MNAVRVLPSRAGSSAGPRISAALALLAGGVLRAWMLRKFFEVNGDSELYGGMAKNLLSARAICAFRSARRAPLHAHPPARLSPFSGRMFSRLRHGELLVGRRSADLFWTFGMHPAGHVCGPDFPACLPAGRRPGDSLAGGVCPFTAVYDAEPLTESLSLFFIALALWSAARFQDHPGWRNALLFTVAVTYSALLRPDGALVGLALVPAVLIGLFNSKFPDRARLALICLLLALAPFAAWTWRNWRVFHVIQPLAPRYATDPGENTWPGWQRWFKTWSLDFVSTYEVYWNLSGSPLDISKLPERAFDSPAPVRRNRPPLRRLRIERRRALTPSRRSPRPPRTRTHRRPPASLLRDPAPGPRGRYVAPPPCREPPHRPRLVGVPASPRGNAIQLVLCRPERVLPAAGDCRAVPAPPHVAVDAGVHASPQRASCHHRSPGGTLHAGMLSR